MQQTAGFIIELSKLEGLSASVFFRCLKEAPQRKEIQNVVPVTELDRGPQQRPSHPLEEVYTKEHPASASDMKIGWNTLGLLMILNDTTDVCRLK